MSWLSRVADALERESEEPVAHPMSKLVVSRQKSIASLEAENAEYQKQIDALPVGKPARVALEAVVRVREQRLAKLRVELAGFLELTGDSRQVELPAVRKAGK